MQALHREGILFGYNIYKSGMCIEIKSSSFSLLFSSLPLFLLSERN